MNKIILITGSSAGIGKDIATFFAKKNFTVILNCKDSVDKMIKLQNQLRTFNKNIYSYRCDISNYSKVEKMFNNIYEKFGTIDILINNAGIYHYDTFTNTNPVIWNNILNTNLLGVINCSFFTSKNMLLKKEGNIINISSIWGVCGASCEVIYSTSKSGVHGFTKSLAKELAPSNIFVNAIACGLIDTQMNDFLTNNEKQEFIDDIPLNRIGKGIDVARLCYSIIKNNYLTGQVISLDGGYL